MISISRILLPFFCVNMLVMVGKVDTVDQGILYQLSNGICPEGLQHTIAILAGGAVAVPGIALNNVLTSSYNDIHPHASLGLQSVSALAGMYALYKVNTLLAKRTPQAILRQKAFLLSKIEALKNKGLLSQRTVIENLERKFTVQVDSDPGYLILIKNELIKLINDIKWINEKLVALNEPTIDLEQLDILERALSQILKDTVAFKAALDMHEKYNAAQYDNKLSTKAARTAWWVTKNSVKTMVQCGWFLTKVGAQLCWDTTKILVKAVIN